MYKRYLDEEKFYEEKHLRLSDEFRNIQLHSHIKEDYICSKKLLSKKSSRKLITSSYRKQRRVFRNLSSINRRILEQILENSSEGFHTELNEPTFLPFSSFKVIQQPTLTYLTSSSEEEGTFWRKPENTPSELEVSEDSTTVDCLQSDSEQRVASSSEKLVRISIANETSSKQIQTISNLSSDKCSEELVAVTNFPKTINAVPISKNTLITFTPITTVDKSTTTLLTNYKNSLVNDSTVTQPDSGKAVKLVVNREKAYQLLNDIIPNMSFQKRKKTSRLSAFMERPENRQYFSRNPSTSSVQQNSPKEDVSEVDVSNPVVEDPSIDEVPTNDETNCNTVFGMDLSFLTHENILGPTLDDTLKWLTPTLRKLNLISQEPFTFGNYEEFPPGVMTILTGLFGQSLDENVMEGLSIVFDMIRKQEAEKLLDKDREDVFYPHKQYNPNGRAISQQAEYVENSTRRSTEHDAISPPNPPQRTENGSLNETTRRDSATSPYHGSEEEIGEDPESSKEQETEALDPTENLNSKSLEINPEPSITQSASTAANDSLKDVSLQKDVEAQPSKLSAGRRSSLMQSENIFENKSLILRKEDLNQQSNSGPLEPIYSASVLKASDSRQMGTSATSRLSSGHPVRDSFTRLNSSKTGSVRSIRNSSAKVSGLVRDSRTSTLRRNKSEEQRAMLLSQGSLQKTGGKSQSKELDSSSSIKKQQKSSLNEYFVREKMPEPSTSDIKYANADASNNTNSTEVQNDQEDDEPLEESVEIRSSTKEVEPSVKNESSKTSQRRSETVIISPQSSKSSLASKKSVKSRSSSARVSKSSMKTNTSSQNKTVSKETVDKSENVDIVIKPNKASSENIASEFRENTASQTDFGKLKSSEISKRNSSPANIETNKSNESKISDSGSVKSLTEEEAKLIENMRQSIAKVQEEEQKNGSIRSKEEIEEIFIEQMKKCVETSQQSAMKIVEDSQNQIELKARLSSSLDSKEIAAEELETMPSIEEGNNPEPDPDPDTEQLSREEILKKAWEACAANNCEVCSRNLQDLASRGFCTKPCGLSCNLDIPEHLKNITINHLNDGSDSPELQTGKCSSSCTGLEGSHSTHDDHGAIPSSNVTDASQEQVSKSAVSVRSTHSKHSSIILSELKPSIEDIVKQELSQEDSTIPARSVTRKSIEEVVKEYKEFSQEEIDSRIIPGQTIEDIIRHNSGNQLKEQPSNSEIDEKIVSNQLLEKQTSVVKTEFKDSSTSDKLPPERKKLTRDRSVQDSAVPKVSKTGQTNSSGDEDDVKLVKTLWATTRINIYDDKSKTFEILKSSTKRPRWIPPTSEALFVVLPNGATNSFTSLN